VDLVVQLLSKIFTHSCGLLTAGGLDFSVRVSIEVFCPCLSFRGFQKFCCHSRGKISCPLCVPVLGLFVPVASSCFSVEVGFVRKPKSASVNARHAGEPVSVSDAPTVPAPDRGSSDCSARTQNRTDETAHTATGEDEQDTDRDRRFPASGACAMPRRRPDGLALMRHTSARWPVAVPAAAAALSTVLLTLLLVLVPVRPCAGSEAQLTVPASAIESKFPSQVAEASGSQPASSTLLSASLGYPPAAVTPLKAAALPTAIDFLKQSATAFKALEPTFELDIVSMPSAAAVMTSFQSGAYDIGVSSVGPPLVDQLKQPSMTYFPLNGNAVTFTYSLPLTNSNGQTLALTGATLCRIYRANITRWDDPAIVATNSRMALSNATIQVFVQTIGTGVNLALTSFCGKVDSGFAAVVPAAQLPSWPPSLNKRGFTDAAALLSTLSDTPYAIGVGVYASLFNVQMPIGSFVNAQGVPVTVTPNSMALNLMELASSGYAAGRTEYDLTSPSTLAAFPLLTMNYLLVDKTAILTTCANKRLLLRFLQFLYSSDIVRGIASLLNNVVFPAVLVSQIGLNTRLTTELTCSGTALTVTAGASSIALHASALRLMQLFATFYAGVDADITFDMQVVAEPLAVKRVALGEISVALVNAGALGDNDVSLLQQGRTRMIPAFVAGVVPIFVLPSAVTTFAAKASTAALGLPPLLPLRVDLELLTLLFLGEINSWTDARVLVLNPQLAPWLAASNASTVLQVVVGATAASDAMSAGKLLFQQMARSNVAADPQYAWAFVPPAVVSGPGSNPFLPVVKQSSANTSRAVVTLINVESRLLTKLQSIGSGVSYASMDAVFTPASEFQLVLPRSSEADPLVVVEPTIEALQQCSASYFETDTWDSMTNDQQDAYASYLESPTTQRQWVDASRAVPGCWGLSALLSFAFKVSYSSLMQSGVCATALHALTFLKFVQTEPILSSTAGSYGLTRLGDAPAIAYLSTKALYSAECDDTQLLVIPPVYWRVASAITTFGTTMGSIGMALAGISAVVVIIFRHKLVIRSASTPFLCATLLGMALLCASVIAWADEPSNFSCSAFLWTLNLGYMLLFTPLFAKTWRVWRIFSGAQLKVVKISNFVLLAAVAALLVCEIIVLATWQGVSPLQPVEYSRVIGAEQHFFTHCSVTSDSGAGIGFVGVVAAGKGLLLLFGALMAFSTRNVKAAFNESAQISWTIYNTLLAALLGVALIAGVSAVEDTLMWLVLLLILWVSGASWALLFVPKFHMLFLSEEKVIEASRSHITQEKADGFSFASIAAMTSGQVKFYYTALKGQLNKAERVLKLPITVWPAGADPSTGTAWTTGAGETTIVRRPRRGGGGGGAGSGGFSPSYGDGTGKADPDPEAEMLRASPASSTLESPWTVPPSTTGSDYRVAPAASGAAVPASSPSSRALRQKTGSAAVASIAPSKSLNNTAARSTDSVEPIYRPLSPPAREAAAARPSAVHFATVRRRSSDQDSVEHCQTPSSLPLHQRGNSSSSGNALALPAAAAGRAAGTAAGPTSRHASAAPVNLFVALPEEATAAAAVAPLQGNQSPVAAVAGGEALDGSSCNGDNNIRVQLGHMADGTLAARSSGSASASSGGGSNSLSPSLAAFKLSSRSTVSTSAAVLASSSALPTSNP